MVVDDWRGMGPALPNHDAVGKLKQKAVSFSKFLANFLTAQ